MKKNSILLILTLVIIAIGCSKNKLDEKGFQVGSIYKDNDGNPEYGIYKDSLFKSKPSSVLLTGQPNIRITTVYKVNFNEDEKTTFIGSNSFRYRFDESEINPKNNWNSHLLPGFEIVCGYNMVNISHYDLSAGKQKNFFEKPVLIWNVYYPSFEVDTLNFKPVSRNYFLVSMYKDDSNKDGFINLKDLRRLYLFDINGVKQNSLIPENYSVLKSEYDSANDFLYVFAQFDNNANGSREEGEPTHIFWIDLKDPSRTGQMY